MVPEQLQDHLQMQKMFLFTPRKDKNVVEVDTDTLIEVRPKNSVHGVLKDCGRICQPKRQHPPLELTEMGIESCFGNVRFLELLLMVTRRQI